jgi:hypothetical protein
VPTLVALVTGLVITFAGTEYQAGVATSQAGEQEASAQKGADEAKDRELAEEPAVRARVRPKPYEFVALIFPEVVAESELRERLTEEPYEGDRLLQEHDGIEGSVSVEVVDGETKNSWPFLFTLIGNRREPVRVLDVRAHILDSGPPLDGTLVEFEPQGEAPVREVLLDLDRPDRGLLLPPESEADTSPIPYFSEKFITLAENEEFVFDLTALTAHQHYRWELEVTVAYGDVEDEIVTIRSDGTDSGAPFEATGWSKDSSMYRGGAFGAAPGGDGTLVLRRV